MELKDFLEPLAVRFVPQISSKKKLIQDISEQAASLYSLDAALIMDALLEREKGPNA